MRTTREIEADKNKNVMWFVIILTLLFCILTGYITYNLAINHNQPNDYHYFFNQNCKVVKCDCSSIGVNCSVCVRCPTKYDVEIGRDR